MSRVKSFRGGNRRRDAKLRFEVMSEMAGTQKAKPKAPPQPRTARKASHGPAPSQPRLAPEARPAQAQTDEHEQAVALRRSPRQYIYEWLLRRSTFGGTDEEIQAALQLDPGTARARRVELVHMKLIVDSGTRRKTRSGRPARVWLATGNASHSAAHTSASRT